MNSGIFTLRHSFRQGGFLNLPNDNMVKTIGVAILLCLVCSIVVSTAATVLKPRQVTNKLLDKKVNILAVSGIDQDGRSVEEAFAEIETKAIDLRTGEYTNAIDPVTYDQRRASKDPSMTLPLSKADNIAQVAGLPIYSNVYLLKKENAIEKIILPIEGYGLWGTLYGFIALEGDAQTVSGITFYEHKETPGLGGEVENDKWRRIWQGKQVVDASGRVALEVIKGSVTKDTPNSEYKVDGLAGATLTSRGVTNLVRFWLGESAFGPFLEKIRTSNSMNKTQAPT